MSDLSRVTARDLKIARLQQMLDEYAYRLEIVEAARVDLLKLRKRIDDYVKMFDKEKEAS